MRFLAMVSVLSLCAAGMAQTFFDDFNRANGGLGPNYTTLTGSVGIVDNQAAGLASGNGLTLVNAGAFTGTYDQTTVQGDVSLSDQSTTLAYVALALGSDGTTTSSHGMFIKVQRQSSSMFNFVGFYTGAGSNTSAITTTGGNFQALTTPFASARMTLRMLNPTTLYTGFDTDFNNVDDIVYNSTLNFPTMVVGNRVGLHVYGTTGRVDNFRAAVPEPATMAVLGLGLGALLRRRRK